MNDGSYKKNVTIITTYKMINAFIFNEKIKINICIPLKVIELTILFIDFILILETKLFH